MTTTRFIGFSVYDRKDESKNATFYDIPVTVDIDNEDQVPDKILQLIQSLTPDYRYSLNYVAYEVQNKKLWREKTIDNTGGNS